jgi:DNA-binding GntR family transcriptional regulator
MSERMNNPIPAVAPIPRPSLHDEVVSRVRDMIVEGQLAAGLRIHEGKLCEQLGVSRTPLREALKVLAQEGLVTLLPNRGAVVTPLTVAELEQTIEVMRPLEVLAGELVVQRISDAGLAEIRALHHEMCAFHARGDLPNYFRANQAIHQHLVEQCGNRILTATYEGLNTRIRRFRYRANFSLERWDEAVAEHAEMLDALTARDGLRLGRLMSQHLVNKAEAVKASLYLDGAAGGALPLRRD